MMEYLFTSNDIEAKSGLDFLWKLPDEVEERIEGNKYQEWVRGWIE